MNFWSKIVVFFKSILILKNFIILPKIYFGKIKEEYVKLFSKSGIIIKIRNTPSTDIHIFTEIWINKEYSKKEFEIKNSDVIIDIGSHIGIFALWVFQNCKNGKIICVEPEKNNFKILNENILKNKISNIVCYNAAGSKDLRKIKISKSEKDSASHSIFNEGKEFFECNTITLEKIFNENKITKCDLLKLDCEGAEFEILLNLESKFFEKIEKICLEYHRNKKLNLDENILLTHLQKYNYKTFLKKTSEKSGLIFAIKS
jgi:FkbM family methyltransferase